jgi:DNA ligase (NAD+)
MNDVELLTQELKEAREAYYNLTPTLNDIDYDAKKERLKQLDPKNKEVVTFDADIPSNSPWPKSKHVIQMGSLDKVNSLDEFTNWTNGINTQKYVITHKIDGSSMELVYEKGKLIRGVTRGKNGIIGEDVLENIKQIPSIPHTLPNEINIAIRGEVVMFKQIFENLYAEQYANPRNTANGKVREKKNNGADCANLEFIAYRIKSDEYQPKTMSKVFEWLKTHKFKIPESITTGDLEAICKTHNEIDENRDKIPYEIDGTVISIDSLELLEELGDLNGIPNGQIAWKFANSTVETRVVDIKWQVGHSGRITPVCVVEPVGIEGVTITNISLHNLSMFNDLKLFKGCRVLISRRNMCIPYVEKNLDQDTEAA